MTQMTQMFLWIVLNRGMIQCVRAYLGYNP
jgi:hypothetical protein